MTTAAPMATVDYDFVLLVHPAQMDRQPYMAGFLTFGSWPLRLTFPNAEWIQWYIRRWLTNYSCGGSRGFGLSLPHSLLFLSLGTIYVKLPVEGLLKRRKIFLFLLLIGSYVIIYYDIISCLLIHNLC